LESLEKAVGKSENPPVQFTTNIRVTRRSCSTQAGPNRVARRLERRYGRNLKTFCEARWKPAKIMQTINLPVAEIINVSPNTETGVIRVTGVLRDKLDLDTAPRRHRSQSHAAA
jgi:hypothetical protein